MLWRLSLQRFIGFLVRSLPATVLCLCSFAVLAHAQTPDCVSFFTFSTTPGPGILAAPGNTPTIDNRQTGCINWTMVYEASGFTGLGLTFQSANGATAPGTMGTYTGTITLGANPSTNTTGATATFNGYVGWFRVALSGLTGTGTVRGALYGYRNGYPASSTGAPCPGTLSSPCIIAGVNGGGAFPVAIDMQNNLVNDPFSVATPLTDATSNTVFLPEGCSGSLAQAMFCPNAPTANQTFPMLFNGITWDRSLKCPNKAIIDDSASGNTQVIALSGTTQIYICKLTLTTAAGVNVQLIQGTGVNCAGATANLSGLYQNAATIAEDFLADQSVLVGVAGDAVCLNLGAATRTTGTLFYAQY